MEDPAEAPLQCDGDGVDLSRRGLRIGAIFIILVASALGALLPIVLGRQSKMHVPKFTFFICKYIGSGVIIATAFMHLLDPAVDNFSDECVEARVPDYPWPLFIALMTIMVMFFIELLATRDVNFDHDHGSDSDSDATNDVLGIKKPAKNSSKDEESCPHSPDIETAAGINTKAVPGRADDVSYPPGGKDHLAHAHEHKEGDTHGNLAGQLTAIFVLEFGVVFHSVFIGLTLGTTDDVVILLIVLVFHQMLEGLGLGSRLAIAPWPKGREWVPYALALGFAISTPVRIAAGIGARPNNATTQKLVNGIFDSISAGILMYTGLVELLAHEFMFNTHMRRAPLKIQVFAYGCVLFGVGIMSLLAHWA